MNISKYVVGAWCGLFAACGIAAVPNVFQANTPAQASQVNQNFASQDSQLASQQAQITAQSTQITALLAQVAALQAQPTELQVKANGVSIGTFVQTVAPFGLVVQRAYSSTGYLFDVITTGNDFSGDPEFIGELTNLYVYFETSNCTGPGYVLTTGATIDERGVAPGQGFVFRVGDNSGSLGNFYIPAGSQVAMHAYGSTTGGTGCNANPTTGTGVIALPNDPAITGVPNQIFAAPITIGR